MFFLMANLFTFSTIRGIVTSMVLFWLPAGICLEAVSNQRSPFSEGENEGQVFGQQAFAFTVSTCLGKKSFMSNDLNKNISMQLQNPAIAQFFKTFYF